MPDTGPLRVAASGPVFHWMRPPLWGPVDRKSGFLMLRYTLKRFGIFAACFVVVGLLVQFGIVPKGVGGSNVLWMLLLAMVISAPISFVALRKDRDQASVNVVAKVDRTKARLDANRSQEDAAVDAAATAGKSG